MVDTLTPMQRSERMSRIRGKNTQPEIVLRKAIHACGLRFRLHVRKLPGSPDLVFPKYHAVVFVHGCFWHQHAGCKTAHVPKSNSAYWSSKFLANEERDRRKARELRDLGWRVAVVWECQVANVASTRRTVARVHRFLTGGQRAEEWPR